jgi:hypothetical protein
MLIGVLIHSSSLLPFVLFTLVFLFESKIKALHLYLLLILSMIISQINYLSLFSTFFENTRYIYYFSISENPVSLLKLFVLNGVCIFVLLHYDKMKETYFYQKYFLIFMVLSVVLLIFLHSNSINTIFPIFQDFRNYSNCRLNLFRSKQRKVLISVFMFTILLPLCIL